MDQENQIFSNSDNAGEALDSMVSAINLQPTSTAVSPSAPATFSRTQTNRRVLLITASIGTVLAVILIGALGLFLSKNNSNKPNNSLGSYSATNSPLSSVNGVTQLPVTSSQTLAINGQLQVNKSLVLAPTNAPSTPVLGEIYYNSASNTPYYYNGSSFVSFTPTPTTVGGASGAISLGSGLTVNNNQLAVSSSLLQSVTNGLTPTVSSVQGQTGSINFVAGNGITINGTTIGVNGATITSQVLGSLQAGNGISVSGGQITNTGVVALTSTGNSIKITPQGNGIFDLEASNGGSGGVVSISSNDNSIAVTNDGTGNYNVQVATNGVVAGTYGSAATAATFTINGSGQVTNASSVPMAINGNQITSGKIGNTYLNTDVALYDNSSSNFTGALQQGGYNVCTTNGNCVGVPGGSIGGSGTSGAIAMFTGLGYTIGNSALTQTSGNLTDSGNLAIQGTGGLTLGTGSATVTLKAAATGTPVFTLPSSVGMSGQCLTTDGSGNLSFANCLSGSGGGSGGVSSLNGMSGSLTLTQGTGLSIANGTNSVSFALANTTVTPNTYGSASSVATFTVNAQGQLSAAGNTQIALNGNQITSGTIGDAYLSSNVALYNNTTSNFTGTLQQNGNNVCTAAGNCTGVAGGSVGGSGTNGVLPVFTGTGYTIGNSVLSQSNGDLTDNGYLQIAGTGGLILGTGTATTAIKSSSSSSISFTLPGSTGTSGQCLTTDGTGILTFSSCLSGSGGGSGGVVSLNGLSGALNITQGSSISITTGASSIAVGLASSGVSAGSYGSASSVATYTVNAQGQITSAGSTPIALNGNQITSGTVGDTYLSSNVALYNNVTSNFTGALQQNGNNVCTTAGNCTGVAGGSVGGSGTASTLAMFTGSGYTVGNSALTQSSGNLTASGNLSIQGTGGLTLGTGTTTTTIIGSSTSAITFTLPATTGSANQCLVTDGTGVLSFAACATGGGGSGVSTLNGLSGALSLQDSSGELTFTPSGNTINVSLQKPLSVANGGTGSGTAPTAGQLLIGQTGGTYGLSTLTSGTGLSIASTSGSITIGLANTAVTAASYGDGADVATYTVNAQGQLTAAGNTAIAINGNQVTAGTISNNRLNTDVALYDAVTSNFTGALQQGGNNVCTTAGNCVGVSGGGIGGSGSAGSLAMFTGSGYTIGNSALTDTSGNLTASGNLEVQGTGGLTLGSGSSSTALVSSATSALTFTLPNSTGSNGQCLTTNGTGTLSFANCLSGSSGGSGGVSSLNGLSGALTVAQGTGLSVSNGASSITVGLANTAVTAGSYGNGADVATYTVNAQGQLTAAGTSAISINGNQITSGKVGNTYLNTDVALYDNATSNFTGVLQQAGNDVCTTSGNCTGVAGGAVGGSGTAGTLAVFTGSGYTVGNSVLTQSTGNLIDSGNLSVQGSGGLILGSGTSTTALLSSSTSAISFTLPSTVGSANQCLVTSGTGGVLSFANCLSGSSGGSGGVSSLNGLSGSVVLQDSSGALTFTPSGQNIGITLAATGVAGSSYGSASSVATFTVNSTGQLTAAGSTAIAINGNQITSGSVAVAQGGTGLSSYTQGSLLYASGSTTLSQLNDVAAGLCLQSGGTTSAPTWGSCSGTGSFINNGTTLQSPANIYIQSTSPTVPTVQLEDTTSQTADLIDFEDSTGIIQSEITSSGVFEGANQITGNNNGGNITAQGGAASGTGIGGSVVLQGGLASSTAGSNGGGVNINGANGSTVSTGGNGGGINIVAGNGAGTGNNNGGNITLSAGNYTGTGAAGSLINKNATNSLTAFQVQNTSSSAILDVDTTNGRVGINTTTPAYALDVNGQINSSTALSVNGVPVCTASGCVAQGSSGSYIQNSTAVQTSANFNIRSVAAASVTAIIQGASGQTADLLDLESYNGTSSTLLDSFNNNGALNVKNLANTSTELALQNAVGTTYLQVSSVSQTDAQGSTDNGSIGVNGASTTAGYAVNVTGSLNATALYAGGVLVCTSTNYCTPSAQSSYYIWNNSTLTQAANFKIQAASTGTVAGVLEANAAGTGNTLNLENGSGAVVDSFGSTGNVLVQPSTNSNTAFQVDNTNSTSIFNVDTATTTPNLITNSSFESSSSGWLGTNATVAQYTSGAWQGNDSLSIATTASGGYGYYTYNALAKNTQYTLSVYVKGAVATSTINLGYTYNGSTTDVCTALSANTNSWTRLTCTFTTPNTTSTNNANIYIKNTTSGQTVYIDGVQLQTGASVTPYNPGGGEQLNGIVESPVTLENSQNSTSAFQIQNSAGTSNLLVADTADNVIGVDLSPSSTGATLQDGGTLSVSGLATFSGGLTVSSGSTFTNASSSLYTAASVANATVNGNIGGVANGTSTVDVATTLNITQTTAGLTLTLPNPTVTTAGRIVYVNSLSGNASFTMYGIAIGANTSASFIWNGSAWEVLGEGANAATSAGVNTVGAIDTFANANGATISGTTIYLQSASASVPGLVNTSTQTFAGAKTFSSAVTLSTLGAASGSTYLCYNSSNQIAACSTGGSGGGGSGPAFVQGGNSFGATAVLGTNDVNSLSLETDGLNQMTIAVGGAVTFKNSTDSVTGFQVQSSGGASVLNVDTSNGRVGINTTSPAYALDVNGVINSNTAIDVGGVPVCTTSTCVTSAGSSNYIQNSTTVQTGANINIRASASNTVAAVVQGASGQTSDLLDIESWNGSSATVLDSFGANGSLLVQNGSSSALLQADTAHMAVGINGASTSAGYNLNVTGSINASGTIYDNGAVVCTVGTCAASSGSGNYIQNGTVAQAANFNVQAGTSGTVAGTIQANASGSADILDLKNGAGTITDSFGSTGNLLVQPGTDSNAALAVNNSSGSNILDIGTNSTINLVTNGGFESGATGWLNGNATIAQANTVAWQGNSSLMVTTTSTNGDAYYTYNSLAANTTYTVSMYAEASGSNIGTLNLGYTYNGTSSNVCTGLNAVTAGWTRLTCTFTTPNTTSTNNANIYIADSTSSQTFYIDGVQLQVGSNATPFNSGGSVQINGIATSPLSIQNSNDSTTAFQVQNSAGTSNLLVADTLDNVVGVGAIPLSSGSTLQVGGTESISTLGTNGTSVLCYNSSYQVSSCGSSAGNGNFIFNSSTNQTNANINIQSVNATTATVQLKDTTSQTADLIDFVNSSGAIQSEITSGGALQGANASGTNTNGGSLNINGGQGTGNGIGGSINFYTASASSTSGSTLNLLGANPVMDISGTNGAVTLQTASLTDNAFNVQATGGASFLDANTASSTLVLGQAGVGGTTAWNSTTALPSASNNLNGSWAANGYLYDIIGTSVYSAQISGNGTIGSWSVVSTLPNSSSYGYQVVTNNGYVYVYVDNMVYMGNDNHLYCVNQGIYGMSGSIYYATLNSNGSLGSWSTAATPTTSVQLWDNNGGYPVINASPAYGQLEVYNGNIYFYGGEADGYINSCSGIEGGSINSTYSASINGTTGALGSWSTTGNSSLPAAEDAGASATYNSYAYVFGGYSGSSNLSSVDYGSINTNGNIVNWTATTSLPVALDQANAVVYKGYVYIVGGYTGTSASNLVYYAPINSNGTIGGWSVSSGSYDLPQALYSQGTAIANNYIYSVGGNTGSANVSNVYYANFPSNLAASAGANFLDNSFDSTTAFQVQNATSSDVLDLDTTNNRLGINTNAPGGKLDVEVGSSSDVAIIANTAGTGNLLQLENNGVNVASVSATGATTFKNSSNSAAAFQIQNSSAVNLFAVNTSTSTVLIGNTSSTALASTVDIANSSSNTTAQTVVIGSNSDASNAVSIDTGTGGTLAIGNSATAHTIQVGTGAGVQTLTLGSINTTSSTTIQGGTSTAAVNIQSGASGTINIATSNVANTVQIGSATNAVTQSINIGNNSTASSQNTVTVGSLIGASATTIQAGTGNINIKTTGLSNSGTVFTTQNDSANLLQVQNAQGVNELNIDSASNVITFGNSSNAWNKDWTLNSNSLPATLADGASVAYNGYIYELGGLNGGTGQSAVYYAQQNTNGSLNAWTATTALPVALWNMNTAVAYNGYMYVLGGYSNGTVATVYYAPINANGSLGSWTATTSMPAARYGGAIAEANGYLYYAGGNTGSGPVGNVYYAPINANGTVGAWTTSANSISAEMDAYAAVYNNYLYIFGGTTSATSYTAAVYIAPINPSTGAVSAFTTSANPLPAATGAPAFIQNGTTVYDIDGYNGGVTQKVYTATLNSNGTTSGWATSQAPYAATYLMSAVSNNYIYLLGGNNSSSWSGNGVISSVYYSYVGGLGASVLQQTTGSTTALQVQDINGKDALNVDTTNNRIGVNTSAPGAKLDIETGASNDVSILANSSGAGNLLQLENAGSSVLTVGSTGVTTFKNSANSINGFQIETSSGGSVFNVDTSNSLVGINNNAPGNLLSIGALTTPASGYQIAVTTGGAANSGIVVQDVASQSSGFAFNLQSSTGTSLASIDYQGNLSVKAATINGNLTVNGHIVTANASGTTQATVSANAGTSATCTITGDDTSGQITLITGTASWASGTQCSIAFSASYTTTPSTVISPTGSTNGSSVLPTVTPSTTGFTINFVNADSAQHTYTWDYANLN